MPLYEYRCNACDHRFERIVKFSDPPIKTCPQCGKDTVHQVLHAPAVQFKGSGWYVSDYARKSSTGTAASSGSAEKAASGGESGGAKESAPAPSGSSEKTSGSGSGGKKSE